jgi:hypothetical protein
VFFFFSFVFKKLYIIFFFNSVFAIAVGFFFSHLFKVFSFEFFFFFIEINEYDDIFFYKRISEDKIEILYQKVPVFFENFPTIFKILDVWRNYWFFTDIGIRNNFNFFSFNDSYSFSNIYENSFRNKKRLSDVSHLNFFFDDDKTFDFSQNYGGIMASTLNIFNEDSNRFLNFPGRQKRFNDFLFLLKNLKTYDEFFFPKEHGKFANFISSGIETYYNDYKIFYLSKVKNETFPIGFWLFDKSKYRHEDLSALSFADVYMLVDYFDVLNKETTAFIRKRLGNTSLHYYISFLQISHLLNLSLEDIQFILYVKNNDSFLKNKFFMDIHWFLYSGNFNMQSKEVLSNYLFFKNNYGGFIWGNFFQILGFFSFDVSNLSKNFSFFDKIFFNFLNDTNRILWNNPFELLNKKNRYNISDNFFRTKNQTHFFLNERDIMRLPFHILVKIPQTIDYNNFFSLNIYNQSNLDTFSQYIYATGDFFTDRLSKYFLYGKTSFTNSSDFLYGGFLENTPYMRYYVSVVYPWFELLDINTRIKIELILENLSIKDQHVFFKSLIKRYYEGKPFYSLDEIHLIISEKNSIKRIQNPFVLVYDYIINKTYDFIYFIFFKKV